MKTIRMDKTEQKRQHCWLSVSWPLCPLYDQWSVWSWCCVDRREALSLSLPPDQPAVPVTLPFPYISLQTLELSKLLATFLCEGDADLLLFIVVKVAGVAWSFKLRNKWSFNLKEKSSASEPAPFEKFITSSEVHLLLVNGDPVGGREPLVSFYVIHPIL